MSKEKIRVDSLSFEYFDRYVLNNISLDISKGSLLGILGPNGSGKTTLIKNILGILKPSNGKILIDGLAISTYKAEQLYKIISFVSQETKYDFPLTVLDTVLLGRIPYLNRFQLENNTDYEIAHRSLSEIGISDFAKRMSNQLSVGEKQLVSIAKALSQETTYIILDEPTSNLDISHSIQIMEKLKDLSKAGKGIIVVLHDLNLAARFCDKILLLKEGNLSGFGNTKDVLTAENINDVFGINVGVFESNITGSSIIEPIDTK